MTTPTHTTETIRTLLFKSESRDDALRSWLHHTGALGAIVKAATAFAGDLEGPICSQTSNAIGDLLSLDLVDVLLDAWSAEGALLAAARSSAANPDTTEHVKLLSQTVTWAADPSVEIRVDEVVVGRVEVTLQLTVDITALEADVRAGSIVMFTSGACNATASLAVNGHTLAQHRVIDIGAPVTWRVNSGIPLLIGAPRPDAAEAHVAGRPARSEKPNVSGA